MERLNISSPVRKIYESGAQVQAQRQDVLKRPIPGDTAMHEAFHIVAAGEIDYATKKPRGNTLGTTRPRKLTAASAAAAEAMGYSGTGWDMHLTENILGVGRSAAIAAARSALSGREEEIQEVATLLEERETIGQKDVEEARENVRRRRDGIHPVVVEIISPGGQTETLSIESYHGEIKIEDGLLKFPKAPKQEPEMDKIAA